MPKSISFIIRRGMLSSFTSKLTTGVRISASDRARPILNCTGKFLLPKKGSIATKMLTLRRMNKKFGMYFEKISMLSIYSAVSDE